MQTQIQTEAQLEENFIKNLEKVGYERLPPDPDLKANLKSQIENLNNISLTDDQYKSLYAEFMALTLFRKAEVLRSGYQLKDHTTNSFKTLKFIDKDYCKNIFQVTSQVKQKGTHANRYDVTILINGFPVIQIELKRRGIELSEAFGQIKRYKRESYAGFFEFIQIFVISNGTDTRYFSNNTDLKKDFLFTWGDENNQKINELKDFTETFLKPCFLPKFIANFMILEKAAKQIKIFRPYQYHAANKIIERVHEYNQNGFIWHTTGSGKTLTSFKVAELLSKEKDIDKVIFTVDRTDLDLQTVEEFKKFANGIDIDETSSTRALKNQLKSPKKLIITTIQKLDRAIKKYHEEIKFLKDKKVIFIFDECHRTQFGKINVEIQKFFPESRMVGFTGTPIFEENSNQGQTTADIFKKCCHKYLIGNAISDGNVLPFLLENYATTPQNDKKYEAITDHIIEMHNQKTNSKEFNAIFATASIKEAIKYKEAFDNADHDLKTAIIYSVNPNDENYSKGDLEDFIARYNEDFGTTFSIEDQSLYKLDVSKKLKTKVLDILIVVDMFLTGFDSPKTNTLYLDKELKDHGLIQAFSRTNRVNGINKPHGNVISFRDLQEETDKAIKLFTDGDPDSAIKQSYSVYKQRIEEQVKEFQSLFKSPQDIDKIQSETIQKDFVRKFKEILKTQRVMESFTDYDPKDMLISERDIQDFKSKYHDLYERRRHQGEDSELNDIDFEINLLNRVEINVDYIISLIGEYYEGGRPSEFIIDDIMSKVNSTPALTAQAGLISEYISLISSGGEKVDFYQFVADKKAIEIEKFSTENNFDKELILEIISEKENFGKDTASSAKVRSILLAGQRSSSLLSDLKKIKEFVQDFFDKFHEKTF